MKLSENKNYINWMNLVVDRRYDSAVEALAKCLEDFRGDHMNESFLLQVIGDTYFRAGKIEKSLEYYSMSEMADAESLQPKQFFAEFLAKKLGNYDEAIKKCDEISDKAMKNPFDETDDDFSSSYYASKAEEIRSFCQQKISEKNGGD